MTEADCRATLTYVQAELKKLMGGFRKYWEKKPTYAVKSQFWNEGPREVNLDEM